MIPSRARMAVTWLAERLVYWSLSLELGNQEAQRVFGCSLAEIKRRVADWQERGVNYVWAVMTTKGKIERLEEEG